MAYGIEDLTDFFLILLYTIQTTLLIFCYICIRIFFFTLCFYRPGSPAYLFFFSLPESYGQAALRLHQSRYQVTGQIFIDILSLDI